MSDTYSREVSAAFDAVAADYDAHYSTRADRADNHVIFGRANRLWNEFQWGTFIDLGCGPGTAIPWLHVPSHAYLGVDPSEQMINTARRRFNRRYRVGDLSVVQPWPHYNVIFGGFAPIQHVENLTDFSALVMKTLAPGGRFLVMAEPTGRPVRVLGPAVVTCPRTAAQLRSAFGWATDLHVWGHRRWTPGWLPVSVQRVMLAAERLLRPDPDRCDWIVVEGRRA